MTKRWTASPHGWCWVLIGLAWLLLAMPAQAAEAGLKARQQTLLHRDWRFTLGDPADAAAPTLDDRQWQLVHLPHSFSLPSFAAGADFVVGEGWYRRRLDRPAAWQGKRVHLEFEAAFQVAEVYVNGRHVGRHEGGYTGFSFDITDALATGDNLIAVRVNNRWNPRLAPRAGEHQFAGGLYRDVRLVVTDPVHIPWYGTAVTTPEVSAERARVRVQTEVRHAGLVPQTVTLLTEVLAPDGRVVTRMSSHRRLAPGELAVFDQLSPRISRPQLWSPETPHVYQVRSTLQVGGRAVDDFLSPLGFRWFEFTADRGFFLNGQHRYLRGANVHQDQAGWGDAVTNASAWRDVAMMKAAGFDFIRGSHYPHDPAFVDATDRQGLVFWSENVFWGIGGFKAEGDWASSAYPTRTEDRAGFEASVRQQLAEMIRIFRNHPSVLVWSMGNEPFFSAPHTMPEVRRFLGELVALSRQLDPSRPAAIGGVQRPLQPDMRLDRIGELAGYNGDGASLELFQNPGVPNLVAEYGSTMVDRPGAFAPGWGDVAKQQGDKRPAWRSGEAIWVGFDHASIAGRKFGAMGIVDYFRLPKRGWYWYRQHLAGMAPPEWPIDAEPERLTLTADRSRIEHADGTDDVLLTLSLTDAQGRRVSRNRPLTLTVVSGPGELPTGRTLRFDPQSDIPVREGQAAIVLRSHHAGTIRLRVSSPGLPDAELAIEASGGPVWQEGTSTVADRPYHRFTAAAARDAGPRQLGTANPTRASSAAPGQGSGLANDGDANTAWQPAADDAAPWLRVDLERVVTLRAVMLRFAGEVPAYQLALSMDGEQWSPLPTTAASPAPGQRLDTVTGTSPSGRFLRVQLAPAAGGRAPAIAELNVLLP